MQKFPHILTVDDLRRLDEDGKIADAPRAAALHNAQRRAVEG